MASAFETLVSACTPLNYTNFNDLERGQYLIKKFSFVKTKYGDRIRCDLEDRYVYLPQRFAANIFEEDIAELNKGEKYLLHNGKEGKNNRVNLTFIIKEDAK